MPRSKIINLLALVCSFLSQISAKTRSTKHIDVDDPNFGPTTREWIEIVPDNINAATPPGLIFYFHGWTQTDEDVSHMGFNKYVDSNNFIMVYPLGMSDLPQLQYPGWNIQNNDPLCTERATSYCYDSCSKLGLCTACSWSPCYDDVLFVNKMVQAIILEHGQIDMSKFVIIGESNGGMFTYTLSGQLDPAPSHFVPWYGNIPYHQYIETDGQAHLLSIYDRYDEDVPLWGGESKDNWVYQNEEFMLKMWKNLSTCTITEPMAPISTPYDGTNKHVSCQSTQGCGNDRTSIITSCHYDGYHGDDFSESCEMILWWIYEFTA